MTFPTVSGSNLLRQKQNLPRDLQGQLNLVFIPFQRWHQTEVDSWSTLAEQLEKIVPGPDLLRTTDPPERWTVIQGFLNEGMRAGIPNPKTRARTITLYLDKANFRSAGDAG